jgi:hypothetical protein
MALMGVINSLINQIPSVKVLVTIALGLLLLYVILDFQTSSSALPIINGRKPFELSDAKLKERYRTNAKELLESGLAKVRCDSEESLE